MRSIFLSLLMIFSAFLSGTAVARAEQTNPNGVIPLALSPDGKLLAAGSDHEKVCLWRTTDGRLLHTFRGQGGAVSKIVFSPDGATLAVASLGGTVRLWNVKAGTARAILKDLKAEPDCLLFSPDSRTLAMHGEELADGRGMWQAQLWNAKTGAFRCILAVPDFRAIPTRFSPDSSMLVTVGGGIPLQVWDVRTGHLKFEVAHMATPISDTASISFVDEGFSNDSGSLGVVELMQDPWITGDPLAMYNSYVVRTADGQWKPLEPSALNFIIMPAKTQTLDFFQDSPLNNDATPIPFVLSWDQDGKVQNLLHDAGALLAFSPDHSFLLAGSGTAVTIWKVATREPVPVITPALLALFPAVLTHPVSVMGATVSLWDPKTGRLVRTLDVEAGSR